MIELQFMTDNPLEGQLLLTIAEAAQILRVSRATLFEMLSRGEIRKIKIGRKTLIPRKEIEEYVDRQLGNSE